MRLHLVVLLAVACGGPQSPAATDDCASVASHLVVLAEHDNGATSGALGGDLHAELDRRCRDDRWSAERRACLLAARTQDATLDCPLE